MVRSSIFKNNLRTVEGSKPKEFMNIEAQREVRYCYEKSLCNNHLLLLVGINPGSDLPLIVVI